MDHSLRDLDWKNCRNVRDLGGLSSAYGGLTLRARLVRSDTLGRLTTDGRRELVAYGIRLVIDLRHPAEAEEAPHAFMDSPEPVAYLNRPLESFLPHVSALIEHATSRGQVYCIIADHYPDLIAGVLQEIGGAEQGGVLIHCHSGKDRTGMIAALALRLAGVSAPLVIEDYALSQEHLSATGDFTPQRSIQVAQADFWSRPTALPAMMAEFLGHLDERYGGVRQYLAWAGMSEAEMDAVRNRLLLP